MSLLPFIEQTVTAQESMPATAANTVPFIEQAATGAYSAASTDSDSPLPFVQQAATGSEIFSATAANSVPFVEQSATASQTTGGFLVLSPITTGESFGSLSVSSKIIPTSIASAEAFGDITAGDISLQTQGIPSQEIVSSITVNQNISLQGFGIESGESFTYTIVPESIPSLEAFGAFSIPRYIAPTGIATAEFISSSHSVSAIGGIAGIPSAEVFGYPRVDKVSSYDLVSTLLHTHVPAFVKEDHDRFLTFMKGYYEWTESTGQYYNTTKKLLEYQDIDSTVDEYAEHLKKEFLVNFPETQTELSTVLKNAKDFYRSKGTEDSYKFFFRSLFNVNAEFYYPRVDVFRLSDAEYIIRKSIKVKIGPESTLTPFDFITKRIVGSESKATAFVENVQKIYQNGQEYYELFLNTKTIIGTFSYNELITSETSEANAVVQLSVLGINIDNGGLGYESEQLIELDGVGGAIAKIRTVDSETGEIQSAYMVNSGVAYETTPTVTFPFYSGVTLQAQGTATLGTLFTYDGFHLNEDSQLSATKYLHDGEYYQQYSYVVLVNESIDKYRETLKKILHPVGLALFGGFQVQDLLDAKFQIGINDFNNEDGVVTEIELVSSASVTNRAYADTGIDLFLTLLAQLKAETYGLGPSIRSLNRDKFRFKPDFTGVDDNSEMAGDNSAYWSTFPNYQIKDADDSVRSGPFAPEYSKINIMPEPILRNSDGTGIESGEMFGSMTINN